MLRSLFSAISGLQAHQTKMDVVGNNIANVNTVGFKSSTTVFEDTLSQILRNGSAPTATAAGTNPAQVGLGVRVASISTNFQQGSTQSTGRASDFMISGDGFFVTKSGTQQVYTRAGSFDIDGSGRLVTPDGNILQGWMTKKADGTIDTNGPIGPLSIPYGQTLAPSPTAKSIVAGNLSADATTAPPTQLQAQVTMYDASGTSHQVSYTFAKTATGWDMQAFMDGSTTPVNFTDSAGTVTGTTTPIAFNPNGTLSTASPLYFANGMGATAWPGPVQIDISGLTQYGGPSTMTTSQPVTGAGSAEGTLESYSLGNDGTITGVFSNGLREPIGQIAIASFANPGGLTKMGNSSYAQGDNSGLPQIGVAGTGGRGSLSAGALEMSNVDLAQEFTGLIIAQRGFQANSKVITTSDQILQDLVQMKQ